MVVLQVFRDPERDAGEWVVQKWQFQRDVIIKQPLEAGRVLEHLPKIHLLLHVSTFKFSRSSTRTLITLMISVFKIFDSNVLCLRVNKSSMYARISVNSGFATGFESYGN